ncbi:uncharacterized protein LOC117189746 isoform X2 [Drosophila miranda]|uniref:uncharacterized protein LOC117189746 isoform X2 n=1 Tax=Drosophila miranda TaxID=7229 RepID=UPI00143F3ABE|nr:uncharacterized protein LOC117189746 isoform X2 [Drosophila miranda]
MKTKGEAEIEINYDSVKRTLQRKRQPFLPKPPSSAENVLEAFLDENIMNRFGITKGNTANQFYKKVYASSSFAYCIFSSDKVITLMQANIPEHNRHYLIDATFKVCPFGDFKQLLIIYIKYLQKITPFVFVLMTRKTELCYQHLFTYIDSNICCLKGASFISDYEKAMRNALKGLHPNMNFYACWFHFTQACKKNAKQSTGFENTLKCNKKAYMLFMKFLHLPLLPESKIVEAFNLLKGEAINLNKKLFSPFLKYFNRQWLKKEGPKSISVFKRSTRTTSSVEAYNLNLGNKIRANGHFFKFVQCLIDAEYEKSREFALLFQNGGNGNQTQKKKLRDRSKKIMDAMDLFERGEIDIQGFLTCTVSLADRFSKQDFFEGVDNESNLTGMSSDMKSSTSSLSSNAAHLSQSSDKSLFQMNPCNVCLCNPKSVLLRPCNHVNICGTCWDQIVAHNQAKNDLEENENIKPKCPSCNREVEEAIRNVFIYN